MKNLLSCSFCLVFLLISCKKQLPEPKDVLLENQRETLDDNSGSTEDLPEYSSPSTDEQTAQHIRNFLTEDYLKDDISFLQPLDRKFQFFKIDLNDDGKEEIFIRFMGPYFCGTGGCTFLLLDKYGEIMTRFSVTRAPIFAEKSKINGWSVLLVKDAGVFKELVYEDNRYPSNPSMLPKAPYDAPSASATVMFGEGVYACKTFDF